MLCQLYLESSYLFILIILLYSSYNTFCYPNAGLLLTLDPIKHVGKIQHSILSHEYNPPLQQIPRSKIKKNLYYIINLNQSVINVSTNRRSYNF